MAKEIYAGWYEIKALLAKIKLECFELKNLAITMYEMLEEGSVLS